MSQNEVSTNARRLVESAVMVAVATVLSLIKLLDLPYGGTVTIASMLPVIIISYRHGLRFGLLTGFVFGIIQQLLSLNTLSYVTTWQSVVAVIVLDYIVAFMVIGLGGLFRKMRSQPLALLYGTLFVCALRYACHVISGATVWAGLSIPTNAALIYSFIYNATYMIPETIVTACAAYMIGSMLDFRGLTIRQLEKKEKSGSPVLGWAASLLLLAALFFDVRTIFANLQNAETGEFDILGLSTVNWPIVLTVTLLSVAAALILFYVSAHKGRKEARS
ncbi:MAG: energy-coupled thiamine transporter ThiT [Lachnospiraceae bacterium]|nr:energy-coupled thiamine transporter ThiT [Lachnospiraceae bacterium]